MRLVRKQLIISVAPSKVPPSELDILTPDPLMTICHVVTSLSDAVNAQFPDHECILIVFGVISSWPRTPGLIETAVGNIVKPFAFNCDLDYVRVCPAVVNDPGVTEIINQAAHSVASGQNVYQPARSFGGEDFSWYLQDVPGAMFRLGASAPGGTNQADLHSSQFDVDERAIGVGVRMLTRTAINAVRAWKAWPRSCTDNNSK